METFKANNTTQTYRITKIAQFKIKILTNQTLKKKELIKTAIYSKI